MSNTEETRDIRAEGQEEAAAAGGEKFRWRVIRFLLYFAFGFFAIAGRSAQWVTEEWGDLSIDEILFTLTQPLKGTDSGIIGNYILYAIVPAAVIIIAVMLAYSLLLNPKKGELSHKKKLFRRWLLPAAAIVGVIYGSFEAVHFYKAVGADKFVSGLGEKSTYIEENYVDPAKTGITFPEKKRNLIYIFLESMEVSYTDEANGGVMDENYIPELTELAKENEDFSGSQSTVLDGGNALKYSTWTMGGMFAATSGLPLKIPIEVKGVGTNSMNTQDSFFPDLTCLGDILQGQGYTTNLLIGSDATFGGRRLYFSEHGNYQFYDYNHYSEDGELPAGYKVWWGYEDERLFQFAKDRLTELSSGDEPFDLTMLTVDTHYPDGYVCRLCDDEFPSQYANVMHCSSRQVTEFIEWCQTQPWYENTTIILSGDHPTMNKTFTSNASYDYRRKVYTCYINAPLKPARDEYREFATVDNFPTTLAALGCKIDGERLGLGTNLFSDVDTLVERDGLDFVNGEMQKQSEWMDKQANFKPVTADITYDEYDPETQTIRMTLKNVTSDKVDGFKVSLHMYGYTVNGSDYVSWTYAEETEPGTYVVNIRIPTQQAFDGHIKIQPHCMINGVRGIHIDTHYYHLKYDAGGGNAESYQCDKYGEPL